MTDTDVDTQSNAQSAEAVAVESVAVDEAPPTEIMKATDRNYYSVSAADILSETSSAAARRLQEFVLQKKNKLRLPNDMRQTCQFILEMVLGKPRQRIESVGVQLTYSDLAKAAAQVEKGRRPVLADVFELSNMVTSGSVKRPETDGEQAPDPAGESPEKPPETAK